MRTAEPTMETAQVHRFSENLRTQLAKGKEWATPGVQAALQRAVAGLDTGIETASPRLQAVVRQLADELAGGVQTLTPRVHERLRHAGPKAAAVQAAVPTAAARRASRKWWWIGALIAIVAAGVLVWRSLQASQDEPAPSLTVEETGRTNPDADPDLTAGRM
ncbi:hypothetical protein J7I84_10690 [Arthrobacter sp. ISL-85]|uniref:hypothetical protein n=1 Tax=Arthrobacter sp. ISL-85 TaxID=2819115 RepID=UPI001BE587BA|nr:hypothetical protein [Arthrobacter sp. ISL-85]MBT2566953.1 hypothetical protein [Arthrobacter sp. ISL-85]